MISPAASIKPKLSSYFPSCIASRENRFLLSGSCLAGAVAMSNVSHAADWISERRADNVALAPRISEDWLSLIIGLLIFTLALAGLANVNLLGWVVTTSVWTNLGQALKTVSNSYGSLGGIGALITTYGALLVVLGAAALALKSD